MSLTNLHTIPGRPTLKDVECFSEWVVQPILSFESVDNFERSAFIRCGKKEESS